MKLPDSRAERIDLYADAHRLLTEGLQPIPQEAWEHRPSEDDWTIHEIVVHITDRPTASSGYAVSWPSRARR